MILEGLNLSPLAQSLLATALFVAIGLASSWLEVRRPARPSPGSFWHTYFGKHFVVMILVFGFMGIIQAIEYAVRARWAPRPSSWSRSWLLSFVLVFVFIDLGQYLIHRAYHTRWLWPVHRWHHSLKEVNWVSGVRGSFLETSIYAIPVFLLYHWFPLTLAWGGLYALYVQIFVHLNIRIEAPRLAHWIVLPQYHRAHHGMDPRFYNRNFSTFWVFWDRWLGTLGEESPAGEDYPLGLEREPVEWRMAVGI